MKTTAAMAIVALAALGVAAFSVYRVGGIEEAHKPMRGDDALLRMAKALAEDELTRLNAAEMIYRNKVYVHVFTMSDAAMPPSRRCMKLYRQFKGYEIEDIQRTTSLLHPVSYSIRFDFDLVGTRGEPAQRLEPAAITSVLNDHAYIVHKSESLVREYLCDDTGKVLSRPVLPTRPNFFSTPALTHFGEFSLEEPAIPAEK